MNIIIIGCGRVGSGLANVLSAKKHNVAIIDQDPASFEKLGANFKGKQIIGIGFDQEALLKAGIEKADALAAVTVSDEANLVAARMAKVVYKVPRVAARVYEPRKATIFKRMGLHIISPVTIGIERLANILSFNQIGSGVQIGAGQITMVDLSVSPLMIGHPVNSINMPTESQIVAITRDGKTFLPSAATLFDKDDLVHIAMLESASERINRLWS